MTAFPNGPVANMSFVRKHLSSFSLWFPYLWFPYLFPPYVDVLMITLSSFHKEALAQQQMLQLRLLRNHIVFIWCDSIFWVGNLFPIKVSVSTGVRLEQLQALSMHALLKSSGLFIVDYSIMISAAILER